MSSTILKLVRPDFVNRVKLYKDPTPLFTRFQIESQIESAFQREVRLPSGGSIIIDHTEALVSIDINSAKSTKGGDIEETALMTNLEAANEIARQLRLRDIGGLIVIDFIDMTPIRNQREVEERLKKALSMDRARVQIGRISRFGLLEMSRQRLTTIIGRIQPHYLPTLSGSRNYPRHRIIRLSIIRIIEEEALKENTAQVRAILPTEIAAYLLNEKRQAIIDIEKRQSVAIIVVPSSHLLTPQYEVERMRLSDLTEKDEKMASYKLAIKPEISTQNVMPAVPKAHQEPAIKNIPLEEMPAPQASSVPAIRTIKETGEPGLLKKLYNFLFDKKAEPEATSTTPEDQQQRFRKHGRIHPQSRRKGGGRHHNRGRRDRGRGGRDARDGNRENREGRENRENRDNRDAGSRNFENRDSHNNRPPREDRPREEKKPHEHPHRDRDHDTRDQQQTHAPREKPETHHQQQTQAAPQQQAPRNNVTNINEQQRNYEAQLPIKVEESRPANKPQHVSHEQQQSNESGDTGSGSNAGSGGGNTGNTGGGERRPRPRFHPRYRHGKNRHKKGSGERKTLEGEDIYSSKKNSGSDES